MSNFYETGAEQAVLGSFLIDHRCLPVVAEQLRPEDFGIEINRCIYRAALALYARGEKTDPVTILEEIRRAGEEVPNSYILQLMDTTPTAANVTEYVPIVKTYALRRGVAELASRVQKGANDGGDPQELLAELADGTAKLEQDGSNKTLLSPLELASRWMDHRMRVESGISSAFVKTGYRDFDIILGGGMISGGMHVLAARPGMGKTTFALNIADRVAKDGWPVLFVSLEMDDEQISAKRIARETGISGSRLLMGRLSDEENKKMAEANEKLALRPMFTNGKPSATVAEIAAMARQVPKLMLLVIDYLGKVVPDKKNSRASRYEYTTEISGEIKTMARTLGVPVLVLAQINRESEQRSDKRPVLADLRDTGAIEQDADTVTFLYRKGYYGKPDDRDPYMPEETECIVAKNRHAGVGECSLDFYAATSKFVTTNADPRSGYRKAIQCGQA